MLPALWQNTRRKKRGRSILQRHSNQIFYKRRKPAAILAIALCPALAWSPQPRAESPALDELVITAKRTETRRDLFAGSIGVVGKDALAMQAHTHIQESLDRLPGVNFHRNNGQEYLPAIRSPVLSGPGACGSFLTAENGVPLRPAGFCNVNELFEAHTEQARRIEVIRGPGTALYGSNAQHGVINVLSPARVGVRPRLGLEAGPNDFGRLKLSGGTDTLGAALTVTHDGGYRDDAGYEQQKLSLRHQNTVGGLAVRSDLTAINLDQETASYIQGHQAYKDSSLAKTNPDPKAFRKVQALRLSSRIGGNQWSVTPYLRYSDMDFLQHFLPGTPLEENGHHSVGILSHFTFDLDDSLQLITGLDLEYADTWLKQTQAQPTEGSPFLRETLPAGKHYDYEVRSLQAAPYMDLEWQPAPAWRVNLGVRFEYLGYDYDNRMLTGRTRDDGTPCGFGGCRYTRPGDDRNHFTNASPNAGVIYQWGERRQLYFSIANGFRAPQIPELYRLQVGQTVADLDSEQLDSAELGLRGSSDRLDYEVAVYAMEKDDVILQNTLRFQVGNGETRHKGLEVALGYDLDEHWRLSANASYAVHQYRNSPGLSDSDIENNDVDSAPRHFGSAFLSYSGEKLSGELQWQHMGDYYTNPENTHSYEGHDLLHLRLRWQLSSSITLSARVLNLTDTRYAERADFTGFGGPRYFPGDPRSLYLGVEFKL